tara:strand:- start:736 stop:1209 length:474 start_codon:yes stop_codon:yes gene_type:complete
MNTQFKFISSLLIALCFSVLSFSQNSETTNVLPNDIMSVKIVGMHCGGCAMTVEKTLNNTDGVIAANVDFGSSLAMVEYDSSINQDEIISVLSDMRGGIYEVTLVSDTNLSQKVCSKGKQCCKVNGKVNADCDQKSSGCCSSSNKECSSSKKKKKKK